jgi:hypothetical protein
MTDCPNAEIRDLLPDYVHDRLSVTDLARVEQHLVSCAECTEELALLQAVFNLRPAVAPVNVAAIVASLPKPGVVVHRAPVEVAGVRSIASAPSAVRKTGSFRNWRAIAAVAVFAVGTMSVVIARQGLMGVNGATALSDSAGVMVSNAQLPAASRIDSSPLSLQDKGVSLSVGDLSDYSDDELEAMMARLDKWDGSASADPLPGVPVLPPGS